MTGRWSKYLIAAALVGAVQLLPVTPLVPHQINTALAQSSDDRTSDIARCGSIDLVILIDTTYSLATAIGEMKREALSILKTVETLSGGDYRLGLIGFDDGLRVLEDLNANPTPDEKADRIRRAIRGLRARGGQGGPEASDEAINTAVNALSSAGRKQEGDFQGRWESHSRILVLITDNVPGGFDDEFLPGVDDSRAFTYASEAAAKGIRLSVIHVPTSGLSGQTDAVTASILRGLVSITGGLYVETIWSGQGTAQALASILRSCGSNPLS